MPLQVDRSTRKLNREPRRPLPSQSAESPGCLLKIARFRGPGAEAGTLLFWSVAGNGMEPEDRKEQLKQKDTGPKLVVEVCAKCGKESRAGSMTAWIFGGKKVGCACNTFGDRTEQKRSTRQDSMQGVKTPSPTARQAKPGKTDQFVSNRYKIGDLIGVGGMGAVYKAYDPQLDKTFAVKILQSELASDPNAVKRFEQEASAMCGLTHANVVAVYDYGVSKDGAPYIVMDYLDGVGLDKMIEGDAYLEPQRVVELFVQVADAVEHAHRKRVIHRDLKPSNIIVTTSDTGVESVKIVDFGIAKVMPEGDRTTQGLTQTGELIGSPYYMSPEQCTGTKMDNRSDIYSIGCVMYECLSGRPPFEGENPIQTILHHLHDLPQDLTGRFRNLEIPDTLNYIVMRCLEKHPGDRYQSADALKRDLELFRMNLPVEIVKPKRPQAKTRIINQLKVTSVVASGVASLVVLGLVVAVGLGVINPAQQQAKLSGMSVEEQWSVLDKKGQEAFDRGELVSARQFFDQALKLVENAGTSPKLVAASYSELADLSRAEGRFEEANLMDRRVAQERESELAHSGEILRQLDAALTGKVKTKSELEEIGNSANDQAASLIEAGNVARASQILELVTKMTAEKFGADSELMTRCLHNQAYLQHDLHNLPDAIAGYKEALALERKVLPADHVHTATTLLYLVRAQLQAGESDKELLRKQLTESLGIFRRINGPNSARVARVRYHLADLYYEFHDLPKAKSELEAALTSLNNAKEPSAEWSARCYHLLALVTSNADYFEKAMQQFEKQPKIDYPFMVRTLQDYARTIAGENQKLANSLLVRAKAMTYHLPGKKEQLRQRAVIETQQGIILTLEGRVEEAEAMYKSALENAKAASGDDSDLMAFVNLRVANFYDDTNAIEKARQYYDACAAIINRHSSEPIYANTAAELAMRRAHFDKKLTSR